MATHRRGVRGRGSGPDGGPQRTAARRETVHHRRRIPKRLAPAREYGLETIDYTAVDNVLTDKFPMGVVTNKGADHPRPATGAGVRAYDMFKNKSGNCIRVALRP